MNYRGRILIIDDRHSLVWYIERTLKKEDFEVLIAFDGLDGLQKAREEKPDLIILDTVMPKMDGYEVYQQLRDAPDTARIPVLFLTIKKEVDEKRLAASGSQGPAGSLKNQNQAEVLDFLAKPFTAEDMVERVRTLLQASELRSKSEQATEPKARILVIDDNHSLVRLIEHTLQKEGYEVLTAFEGLEGLRKARKEKPDLIVLDLVMPGLDGFQVLDLVRQQNNIPVIILTSDSAVNSVTLTLALGANDYVVKPVSARDLLARVQAKLAHPRVKAS